MKIRRLVLSLSTCNARSVFVSVMCRQVALPDPGVRLPGEQSEKLSEWVLMILCESPASSPLLSPLTGRAMFIDVALLIFYRVVPLRLPFSFRSEEE